jgi:GNAT superfamily N-acetyltransferase
MPTFQPVTVADTNVLRELAERTFRDAWQTTNDPVHFEDYCRDAFTNEQLIREIEHPGSEFYFVFENKQLAAYLKLNFDKQPEGLEVAPNVQIERVYVLQDFQGRGLGATILDFVARRAQTAHAKWVWLSVWKKSPRSINFYQKNGFTIFGTETFWVGNDPQEDWVMSYEL